MSKTTILCLSLVACAPFVFAQSDTSSIETPLERTAEVEEDISGLETGQQGLRDSETGTQRVIKQERRYWRIDASYNLQVYYTSDLFLSDQAISEYDSVGIMSNRLDLRTIPVDWVSNDLIITPSIGLSWNRLNHFGDGSVDLDGFDFEHHRVYTEARIRRAGSTLSFTAGLEYARLYDFDDRDTTYSAISPYLSVKKLFSMNDTPIIVTGDLNYFSADRNTGFSGYNLLDEDSENRWQAAANVFSVMNWGKLQAVPFFKLAYIKYTDWPVSSREDMVFAFGANLSYPIWKAVRVRAFGLYENKSVDESFLGWPDYEKYDLGVGLTAGFSF